MKGATENARKEAPYKRGRRSGRKVEATPKDVVLISDAVIKRVCDNRSRDEEMRIHDYTEGGYRQDERRNSPSRE